MFCALRAHTPTPPTHTYIHPTRTHLLSDLAEQLDAVQRACGSLLCQGLHKDGLVDRCNDSKRQKRQLEMCDGAERDETDDFHHEKSKLLSLKGRKGLRGAST